MDAVYEGKEGRWITTKTGRHIFIENGKSVKEALADAFEDFDWESDPDWHDTGESYDSYYRRYYYDFFVPEITDPTEKAHKEKVIKSFKGVMDASYAYIKNGFKNLLMKHKVLDYQLEDIVANMFMARNAVQRLWLQDIWVKDDSQYNRYTHKMSLKYDGDRLQTLLTFYHESGHALDNDLNGSYYSTSYISPKYNSNLSNMLKSEITEDKLPILVKAFNDIDAEDSAAYKKYKAGDISRDEYRSIVRPEDDIKGTIGDVIHSCLGYDAAKNSVGWTGHFKGYFNNYVDTKYNHKYDSFEGDSRRGAEFFAEMIASRTCDRHSRLDKLFSEVAPKSIEIFNEILKEKYGYERK